MRRAFLIAALTVAANGAVVHAQVDPLEEDGLRIDVLFVYTTTVVDRAREETPPGPMQPRGVEQVRTLIDLLVSRTNQAFRDSGVVQRLYMVATVEVLYVESDVHTDHRRLSTPDDGHLDEVLVLRDSVAADVVAFVGYYEDPEASLGGGEVVLYSLWPGMWPDYSWLSIGIGRTFAHELGHVMGLSHDRRTLERAGVNLREIDPPYSVGYVNKDAFRDPLRGPCWHTIMAYDCTNFGFQHSGSQALLRFSNPDQTHGDAPLGVPGDQPSADVDGPADARRALNEVRMRIANIRAAPCLRGGASVSLRASNGQYVTADRNGGGAVTADEDAPGPWGTLQIVDPNGGCVENGDTVYLRTSDGFYLRAAFGTLDATGTTEGQMEAFTLHRTGGWPMLPLTEPPTGSLVRRGDYVRLQASDGQYVSAENGGGGAMNARGMSAGEWETFLLRTPSAW